MTMGPEPIIRTFLILESLGILLSYKENYRIAPLLRSSRNSPLQLAFSCRFASPRSLQGACHERIRIWISKLVRCDALWHCN